MSQKEPYPADDNSTIVKQPSWKPAHLLALRTLPRALTKAIYRKFHLDLPPLAETFDSRGILPAHCRALSAYDMVSKKFSLSVFQP